MAHKFNYGWQKDFVAEPDEGAVERDLTQATFVLDMENTLGEKFRWEVGPGQPERELPSRPTGHSAFGDKTSVWLLFPL